MNESVMAIALGIIQGITEFLPISSSGHLIVFSYFTQGQPISLTLNVALHMGTLGAILIYFRRDWFDIIGDSISLLQKRNFHDPKAFMPTAIIIGTIPAAIIGLLFKDDIERVLHHPAVTIAPLISVGVLLYFVDKWRPQFLEIKDMNWKRGLFVGFAQAIALIPGTSRSGITIIAGRWLGFNREDSARFSFLLGAPVMMGAVLLDFKNILASITEPEFYIGLIVSFIVGYLTIAFLLTMLRKHGFAVFAVYRVVLGIVIAMLIS